MTHGHCWKLTLFWVQVKGHLKDKNLKKLVDADLLGDYNDKELEQLIQVAILCTQVSPMGRPKMSEVVSMLNGDGLAERWDQWQKEEQIRQEFDRTHPYMAKLEIFDSTANIQPEELSGPR